MRRRPERPTTGAIYHHIGARDELGCGDGNNCHLGPGDRTFPSCGCAEDRIRGVTLALFDAIAEHHWLDTRLTQQIIPKPASPVTVEIFERFGRQPGALGVPRACWFHAALTLVYYTLGAVSQNARVDAGVSDVRSRVDREAFLDVTLMAGRRPIPNSNPLMHAIVGQVGEPDDRELSSPVSPSSSTGCLVASGLPGPAGTATLSRWKRTINDRVKSQLRWRRAFGR